MNILTIETTGHFASVALGERQIKNDTDYSHLQEITPMCMEILASAGLDGKSLDAIAVSRGPGSFTGIRIGMATAKGLAQIWRKPIIAVPTLDSFAWRSDIGPDDIVVPVFDARRSQVYAAAYKNKKTLIPGAAYDIDEFKSRLEAVLAEDGLKLTGPETMCTTASETAGKTRIAQADCATNTQSLGAVADLRSEDLSASTQDGAATIAHHVHFFGDGTALIGQESVGTQEASQVLALAIEMFKAGDTTDCYGAEPEYMRLAEAERKLKEKK